MRNNTSNDIVYWGSKTSVGSASVGDCTIVIGSLSNIIKNGIIITTDQAKKLESMNEILFDTNGAFTK